jgi:branched-chain amino acid transport system permease protein
LVLALGACGQVDEEQARLCTGLIAALDGEGPFSVVETLAEPDVQNAVIIRYVPEADRAREHWITCRFAAGGLDPGRLNLVSVATDRAGELSDVQLALLHRWWLGEFGAALVDRPGSVEQGAGRAWAYGAQQVVNAIGLSSVYVLLALAFTLVYGALRRINLAFGDFAMAGAYVGLLGILAFGIAMGLPLVLVLILALLLTGLSGGLWGWTVERAVFRPMRRSSGQAALIASVGLAILDPFTSFTHVSTRLSRSGWTKEGCGK